MNRKTRNSASLVTYGPTGNIVYVPKRTVVQTSRGRSAPKTSKNKKKKNYAIGRMASVRSSAPDAAIIYGTARVGGVYSYLSTNRDAQAYLRTGENDYQIVWIARIKGSIGNLITVTLELGNTIRTIVQVEEKAITVKLKRSGPESRATANDVIAAIRDHETANKLVTVHKGEGSGQDYVEIQPETALQDGGGTQLHHYITIAGHEIDSVTKLYLDDQEVPFGARPDPRWAMGKWYKRVFMAVQKGRDDQEAQPDLVEFVGDQRWTTNHRQRGCAGVYLKTIFQSNLFPNGIPDVEFLVKGKKCFDFRDNSTRWTSNAALVLADFLTDSKVGCGVKRANLNAENWAEAARVCDERVDLSGGGTEARYSINGSFDTGASVSTIIDEMLQAMAGDLVYESGEWFCYPGKYRSPSWAIDEGDLRDEIKIKTAVSRKDRFNAVQGTFVNPDEKYTEDDYTSVKNSYYAEQDGQIIFEDIPQPFVTSNAQAQRIAKIELERVRQGIEVDVTLGGSAIAMAVCDVVSVTYQRFGWIEKEFEVRDLKISDDTENGLTVTVKLRETAAAIYEWSAQDTTRDLAPDTNLPNPFEVAAPTGLSLTSGTSELYIRNDGTVFARMKVAWTQPDDEYVIQGGRYDIQYRRTGTSAWIAVNSVDGDQSSTWILDVQDGQRYDVRIRSVNTMGVSSDWLQSDAHLVVGKSAAPTDVTRFVGYVQEGGIFLQWNRVPDLDVKEYEIRLGDSWDNAGSIVRVSALSYLVNIRKAGVYSFAIKAVDTSGNYSQTATSITVSILKPSMPQLYWAISGEDVVLSWTKSDAAFALDNYKIYLGPSFDTSEQLATVKALNYRFKANWLGERTFYVRATDVAGNMSEPAALQTRILSPNKPANLSASVIDNNVLFRWDDPAVSSLPISSYELRKGPSLEMSQIIGTMTSTFATHFEFESGNYNYFLTTIDSAGNVSDPATIAAKVNEPPDFQFFGRHAFNVITDVETSSDAVALNDTTILFPVSHKTWQEHFSENGWTTVQAQAAAGYDFLVVPNDTGGSILFNHDFGAVIATPVTITLSYISTVPAGAATVTPTMSVSADGLAWRSLTPNSTRELASNVRFVRVLFDVVSDDEHGLATLSAPSIQLSIKEGSLAGRSTTNSSGQQTISIAGRFADVTSITVTPGFNPGFAVVSVYDFEDQPNPSIFTVYTYRGDTGDPVGNIPFSYNLRGVLS